MDGSSSFLAMTNNTNNQNSSYSDPHSLTNLPTDALSSNSSRSNVAITHNSNNNSSTTTKPSTINTSTSTLVSALTNNPDNTTNAASTSKKSISYSAERVIGNGSFGVVYMATALATGETVAIKKVLLDKRFKNRELEIMQLLHHPNIIELKQCFNSKGEKTERDEETTYLHLVMDYFPETIHRALRNYARAQRLIPIILTKVYFYQICRALGHLHSIGICHRDVKPQNLLLNPATHIVKLCDFGSAKMLVSHESNVAYICSRYYRAPELLLLSNYYDLSIDTWSLGCVFLEMLCGRPLFSGGSTIAQLVEIMKVLGAPTAEEVKAMHIREGGNSISSFPPWPSKPLGSFLRGTRIPMAAIDLAAQMLRYSPNARLDPFSALSHCFFDELRSEDIKLPNDHPLPPLFNWTDSELSIMKRKGGLEIYYKMTPVHFRTTAHAQYFEST
jgi:serine/threonine protein kinase